VNQKQIKNLQPFKTIATYGGGFGIIFLLFSIFASGYNILLGLGVGITAASIVLFLFGTFLSMMEEYTLSTRGAVKIAKRPKRFYY